MFGHQMVSYMGKSKKNYNYVLLTGSPRKMEDVEIYAMNYYGGIRDVIKGFSLMIHSLVVEHSSIVKAISRLLWV